MCLVRKDALQVILSNLSIPIPDGYTRDMQVVLYKDCVKDLKKALAQDLSKMVVVPIEDGTDYKETLKVFDGLIESLEWRIECRLKDFHNNQPIEQMLKTIRNNLIACDKAIIAAAPKVEGV
jgi:hypothetical protein